MPAAPENYAAFTFYLQEPAYLCVIVAGMMAKTDVIGVVAAFEIPDVCRLTNGYIAGARSVNPKVKPVVTFIESWYDPPKAKESALAQIEAEADYI